MNPQMPTTPESRGDVFPQAPLFDETGARRTPSEGAPSKPLLGTLPIARLIPQDVHSVMDYGNGLMVGIAALFADEDSPAVAASLVLAGSVIGVSALTDYRISVAKLIPIEAHEAIDYVWGVGAIAAPFLFGYWRSTPKTALVHVVFGAGAILASLFTDYRAYRGRGR
jgi:hypothetical protein